MKKRRHIFGRLSHHSKSAATTSSTPLEPLLNEPSDRINGAPLTGNRSQDAPVRDLWGLAIGEKLTSKDKEAIMSSITSDSKLDILQHLHSIAVKKRTECEDQRWKIELNGRQIILRDLAEKIIMWIDKFKQIGDIAVNFDPIHASLPWAGVRFLLEVAVAESRQMGALLAGVERLTFLICRCQIYESLYLKNEQSKQEEWKEATKNLTSALLTLYASLLSFLANAIRAYNQGTMSRTLHAILNPAEGIGLLDKWQKLENDVAHEADNCDRIHSRQTARQITSQIQTSSEELSQKLNQILANLQTPILRIDPRVTALCEILNSSERQNILGWISGIPYEENHLSACQGRTNGTGKWLLRHKQYHEWRSSSASMILWLHGEPGAGKTKLISTVVDDLSETFRKLPNNEAFAYFYCDRNQYERQEPASILSSFVRQLSISQDHNEIQRSIIQLYNQKTQTGFVSRKLKLEESQTVLADLFQLYPQVTLVIDALDECDKKTRLDLMGVLDKLIEKSSKPVKILISSRQDRDIKRHFETGPNLAIKAVDNQDDIAMFLNHELSAAENFWHDEMSSELKDHICHTLLIKSRGMFQWVALQIAELRELCSERDIRKRIGKLPETLKKAYDEIYDKIQSQKESAPVIAQRAFQWVMCSCWPLTPAELVAAVCQDPDTDEIDEVDISMNTILGACHNLLVVDQNVCRFSHLSVQEYFENHHWSARKTDCLVGKVCLSLLIKGSAVLKLKENGHRSAYDVLEYACLNWVIHLRRLEQENVENRLTALLKKFLGSMDQSSFAYQNWHEMVRNFLDVGSVHRTSRDVYELPLYDVYNRLSPCSWASFSIVAFGFYRTILDWWTVGFSDVNQENSCGESLLQLGATSDSVSSPLVMQLLLDKGADIHAFGGLYGSALQEAALRGKESVVQLLLNKGAKINASEGLYGTALQAASRGGHESLVQLLLDKGAEINMLGGQFGSALVAASFQDHESLVQLLLDNGAEINKSGGDYGSALGAASYRGHESLVQLLLDNGAEINKSGGEYGSALGAASYWGHESLVQLLLDNGAEINKSGGEYGSALGAASYRGHESLVQLLLDNGAEINKSGGDYGSALGAASYWGHESLVQLLLDKGAEINIVGGDYGSALGMASFGGHESLVQLLLDKGAEINIVGEEYGSALGMASFGGHESLVQLLLDNGAEINASGGFYGTALQTASYRGHESLVQLLLEKGADVNMPGGAQKTALMIAVTQNQKRIVKALLSSGADPGREDGLQRSALYWAACNENSDSFDVIVEAIRSQPYAKAHLGSALHEAVARNRPDILSKLLKEGADLDYVDRNGWSPLYCARQYRLKNMEEMLITAGAVNKVPILRQPSGWEESDKAAGLIVLDNGRAAMVGESNINSYNGEYSRGTMRANHCMTRDLEASPDHGVYYFEVEILKGGKSKIIGVGFGDEKFDLYRMPGWDPGSWGYHGDDGRSYNESGSGKAYGPTFDEGDIIGCGVNFKRGTAFFTKNGEMLGNAFDNIRGRLYPMVGFDTKMIGTHVSVNFGDKDFRYQGSLTDTAKQVVKSEQDVDEDDADVDDQDEEGVGE